jgi:hypothetical protein
MAIDWEAIKEHFESGHAPDQNIVDAYNLTRDRIRLLAQFVREEYLSDLHPQPHTALKFIAWWERCGGETFYTMGIFDIGGRKYYIRDPAGAINWLKENIQDGAWSLRDMGAESGARVYYLHLSPGDERVFGLRWT